MEYVCVVDGVNAWIGERAGGLSFLFQIDLRLLNLGKSGF
jgi:hypothetical protein